MPRLFVPAECITTPHVRLSAPEIRHLRALRLRPGSRITVFDDRGREYDATIRRISARAAELDLRPGRLSTPASHGPPITLIAGILKGHRMDLLVEKATELGVSRIIPALTEFTVARSTRIDSARAQRWRRLAVSAATQCGRPSLPSVGGPVPFADAVRAAPQEAVRVLLWEREHRVTLPAIHAARPEPLAIAVAVGPEGGFAPEEVALARTAGFIVSGLGPRTLRAETAAIVALALCQATWGDLSQQAR